MYPFRLFKKGLCVLVGCVVSSLSFAQVNFLPGQVVTLKGDTLYGFIDYRNWEINPARIYFKSSTQESPSIFKPRNIKSFEVADEIYVSAMVNLEGSPNITSKLGFDSELNLQSDTVFLQTLIGGEKSLYFHKNTNGVSNFFITRDSIFDLLVYKKHLVEQEGKYTIKENKKYIGQLAYYLGDCELISSKINGVSYTQKSLVKLFKSYYDCLPSELTFKREAEKATLEMAILAGMSRASIHFNGNSSWDYLKDSEFSPSFDFSGGLVFEIFLPRNQGRWSISNEILFSTYNIRGVEEKFIEEDHYSVSTIHLGYSYLKVNNLIRYKFPMGQSSLFFNGGISNGFGIREKNNWRQDIYFYGVESTVEDAAIKKARKYEQGLILGAGIKHNRISFEVRQEWGNGMSSNSNLRSTTKRSYFLLGYRFY